MLRGRLYVAFLPAYPATAVLSRSATEQMQTATLIEFQRQLQHPKYLFAVVHLQMCCTTLYRQLQPGTAGRRCVQPMALGFVVECGSTR